MPLDDLTVIHGQKPTKPTQPRELEGQAIIPEGSGEQATTVFHGTLQNLPDDEPIQNLW